MKSLTATIASEPAEKGRSLWSDAAVRLKRNRAAVTAAIILTIMTALVIAGPWLSPYDYDYTDWDMILIPPDIASGHFFGTDGIGRDIFVRTLIVSLVIGIAYGATAGYFGGRVDHVMMRIVDILYAMPFMFFVILLMVMFGRNIVLIFVAIGAINWLDMARIVRGQTLSLKRKEFVEAAEALGVKPFRIIRRHIVPNLLGIVVVYVTLTIPQVILVESFLSFLGLGVQEPMTSWGALVNEGAQEMESAPWTLVFPAVLLAATLFCFNFIGDGLRDALDPKDR